MKKLIIIGGTGHTNSLHVRAAIERQDVEIIHIADTENSEIKELTNQLNELSEVEDRMIRDNDPYIMKLKNFEPDYAPHYAPIFRSPIYSSNKSHKQSNKRR